MPDPAIDLNALPLGHVFDPRIPWATERRHMPGWHDAFNPVMFPSLNWRVVEDHHDGKRSLEFPYKRDGSLLCGQVDWADYSIEADVRQHHHSTLPWFDDEYTIVSRTGVLLRHLDMRRYYTLCFEGLERLVLYRRFDDDWTALASREMTVDPPRYYRLKLAAEGDRLQGWLDGEALFDVRDGAFAAHGLAGLRTSTFSRFRNIHVSHTPEQTQRFDLGRDRAQRELDELRERNPKPVLAKTIKLPADVDMTAIVWPGRLRSPQTNDLIVIPRDIPNYITFRRILAVSQEGEKLWEVHAKVDSREGAKLHGFSGAIVSDVDGDGLDEVITAFDGVIKILRGRDGSVMLEAPLPQGGVYGNVVSGLYESNPRGPMRVATIYPVRWKKGSKRKGYVVMEEYPSEGGNCVVALDENLQQMWRRYFLPNNYGHTFEIWDLDGDGREEVIAGYTAVNADGDVAWRMEVTEQIDDEWGAKAHPDVLAIADFQGDGKPLVAYAAGSKGFYLADATTGKFLRHHKAGHVQWVWGARMLPDRPEAMQIVTNTLHGNFGIFAVYTPRGELLHRWQVDQENCFTPPINWSGTGEHLLPLTCHYENFGLWDARGRKVVDGWITPDEFNRLHGGPVLRITSRPWDLLNQGRDQLLVMMFGEIRVYAQDRPAPSPLYRTTRRTAVWPLVSFPEPPESPETSR